MTKRISLFTQQALRPYKQAIAAISILFLMVAGFLGYLLYDNAQQLKAQDEALKEMFLDAESYEGNIDSLRRVINANQRSNQSLQNEIEDLKESVRNIPPPPEPTTTPVEQPPVTLSLEDLFASVYYIEAKKITVSYNGSTETLEEDLPKWSGTGFVLNDGRFITARHVIDHWQYLDATAIDNSDENELFKMRLNIIDNNGGDVVTYFEAKSPDGTVLNFKSTDFQTDRSADSPRRLTDPYTGELSIIMLADESGREDWTTMQSNITGGLSFDNARSANLSQQDQLHVLGYPLGLGARDREQISPIYGSCVVASEGLNNGIILVTDRNFEQGNSGGPVFYRNGNEYVVVGIVSAGAGGSTGFLIPIISTQQ